MPIAPWRRSAPALAKLHRGRLEAIASSLWRADGAKRTASAGDAFQQALLHGTGDEKIAFTDHAGRGRPWCPSDPLRRTCRSSSRVFTRESKSELTRHRLNQYMSARRYGTPAMARGCGSRVLAVTLGPVVAAARQRPDLTSRSSTISPVMRRGAGLTVWRLGPAGRKKSAARCGAREILQRPGFLEQVGLDYLTLNRESGTLSGGEAQRIRLATQIGSKLTGVLYILDEPSIGLHQRDNERSAFNPARVARPGCCRDRGRARRGDDSCRRLSRRSGAAGGIHPAARSSPPGPLRKSWPIPSRSPGRFLSGSAGDPRAEDAAEAGNRAGFAVVNARENNLQKGHASVFPSG